MPRPCAAPSEKAGPGEPERAFRREPAHRASVVILYAESREHRTLLRTREEEIPCAGSLGSIEESLIPHGFFRCHAAFVVSFAQVERLDGGDVIVGGRRVPLSKHRRKQFLAALAAYWGERG